ncbi:hypothetical protein ABK040_016542 [Willaertia magna]
MVNRGTSFIIGGSNNNRREVNNNNNNNNGNPNSSGGASVAATNFSSLVEFSLSNNRQDGPLLLGKEVQALVSKKGMIESNSRNNKAFSSLTSHYQQQQQQQVNRGNKHIQALKPVPSLSNDYPLTASATVQNNKDNPQQLLRRKTNVPFNFNQLTREKEVQKRLQQDCKSANNVKYNPTPFLSNHLAQLRENSRKRYMPSCKQRKNNAIGFAKTLTGDTPEKVLEKLQQIQEQSQNNHNMDTEEDIQVADLVNKDSSSGVVDQQLDNYNKDVKPKQNDKTYFEDEEPIRSTVEKPKTSLKISTMCFNQMKSVYRTRK